MEHENLKNNVALSDFHPLNELLRFMSLVHPFVYMYVCSMYVHITRGRRRLLKVGSGGR